MTDPTLTPEQNEKLKNALGDGTDFPWITDDPIVNWAVDCHQAKLNGEEPPEYDEEEYDEEIAAWKEEELL